MEKIFANDVPKKRLISQIYKHLIQFNTKKKKKEFDLEISYQAPLSMEFFREEYWSGLPFPSPG